MMQSHAATPAVPGCVIVAVRREGATVTVTRVAGPDLVIRCASRLAAGYLQGLLVERALAAGAPNGPLPREPRRRGAGR